MVDLWSSSRQIFQKVRDAGGTAASEPTMHPRKREERFISASSPHLSTMVILPRHREKLLTP